MSDVAHSPSFSPVSLSSGSNSNSDLTDLLPPTPPNMHQNSADPEVSWLVQKYGGTSVGKFAVAIAEQIVPTYLDQHKLAIVCSARSGSTKALGTTNLLIRAADEALQRIPGSFTNGHPITSGINTPQTPSSFGNFNALYGRNYSFTSRQNSVNGTYNEAGSSRQNGKGNGKHSQPTSPQPDLAHSQDESWRRSSSGSNSPSPLTSPRLPPNISVSKDSPSALVTPPFIATIEVLQSEHIAAARSAIKDPELLRELLEEIEMDCDRLRNFLFAAQIIDEISPRSRDNIVGVGERMACKIITAVLRDRGIDAEYVSLDNIVPELDEGEIGDGHSQGKSSSSGSLDQAFYDRVAIAVGERIKQCGNRVPVVTGFFGPVPGSLLRQVGRGYTDLLAALLAVGLSASELQIWKEVDGIFTADPRKVSTARLIPMISPDEAAELTYYGSEVVHPFTMEQVIRRKIPIRIKNVENPAGGGTVIHPDPDIENVRSLFESSLLSSDMAVLSSLEMKGLDPTSTDRPISPLNRGRARPRLPTAVTIKERILVINVHSNRKSVSHGFFAGIFSTLDRFGVVVDLISTSEVHVSMAIEGGGYFGGVGGQKGKEGEKEVRRAVVERVVKELKKYGTVSLHPNQAILSLVGSQMRNYVGIAGRMFTTLAEGNVNIEMISQGASEINISCVIDGRDAVKALNLIHQSCLMIRPEGALGRGPWLF